MNASNGRQPRAEAGTEPRRARGLLAGLARTRASKLTVARATRTLSRDLRAGVWLLTHPNAAVHWSASALPAHLRRSKLQGEPGWRSRLRGLLRALVPPVLVVVPRSRDRDVSPAAPVAASLPCGRHDVLFLVPPGREAVLFDAEWPRVSRVSMAARIPTRVIAVRHALRMYLPMPEFEVAEDGRYLCEARLDGAAFHDLDPRSRLSVFATLLNRYATLVERQRRSARPAAVAAAFDAITAQSRSTPALARLEAERDRALREAANWPCVPSHGDLHRDNLVVVDGEAHLIDFEFAGVLPFFYDVATLMLDEASRGRDDLITAIGSGGACADGWRHLWNSAGLACPPGSLAPVWATVMLLYARSLARHKAMDPASALLAAWGPLLLIQDGLALPTDAEGMAAVESRIGPQEPGMGR